jgi:hypothetical protein
MFFQHDHHLELPYKFEFKLGWNFSHHLRSYNINTFSSFIISSSSTNLWMSLSIGKFGPVTLNVNDGICLSFEIYALGELEACWH